MRKGRWGAWVGAITAAAMGLIAAVPARAEEPQKRASAAAIMEVEEANGLEAEALRLFEQSKYEEARTRAQRALAIREKALGLDHPNVAASLNTLAALSYAKGDWARAEPLFQRALAILEKVLGPDHPDVATCLNNLAELFTAMGDLARAEPLFQRSLSIREKELGPDHADVAASLNNLAGLYYQKGDYTRAEPLYVRSLAILEKVLGQGHQNVATSLNNLAALYKTMGDSARAEPLYLRSLAIMEEALGQGHPDIAASLNNLAGLYEDKGEFAAAEPLYLRSLTIKEEALGQDHPGVAASLNNLGGLYETMGDLGRAEPLYVRSLAILEKANGQGHPNVASSLNNLAGLYKTRGDFARAEPLYKRSLAILEKALGQDHAHIAASLNNLAELYSGMGDWARAEPLFQRSLAILEKALGQEHPNVATSLNNLALLHQDKGDLACAEPLLQRSLAIREKALGQNHPHVAASLHNLAFLYIAQGRSAEAFSATQRAADIQDRNTIAILTIGSEEQKRLYVKTLLSDSLLSMHIQHAPENSEAARFALTILLRRKGRVLDAMADSLAALRRSLNPADRERLDKLTAIYSELAKRASRGPEKTPPEQYRKDLAALEQSRQTLEAEIAKRSATFRAEQRPVTLSEVQAKIPQGAALVEIARYKPFDPRLGSAEPNRWGAPRYVAYVLRPSGDPAFADLGEANAIDAAVAALRNALGDPDLTRDPKPAARALDGLFMQPIRKLLGDTSWVFLSPDGPLQLIPFGALVDEQGHYLVERYLFSYLTTGRDLLRFSDKPAPPRELPLVLANPAFHDNSAPTAPKATRRGLRSIDMVTQSLTPLESTVGEASTIAHLFPESRVLLGAHATEQAVKTARAPALLHLATHGFFLPEQPIPEELLRDPGGELTPAERAALLQRENPLLRSGIALAGFDQRRSGSEDGVLTALEAAGLDLVGTRLVVLSACESGVGEASSGEGVYGLRRALTMAGSETQVMSLWQVDTGRTRDLMQAFYQRLQGGAGRSEAMRKVQLAMLANSKTAHPNLWASFIVSGNWRAMDAISPEVGKVEPSAHGSACAFSDRAPRENAAWLAVALGLAAARRRRSPTRCS